MGKNQTADIIWLRACVEAMTNYQARAAILISGVLDDAGYNQQTSCKTLERSFTQVTRERKNVRTKQLLTYAQTAAQPPLPRVS